MSPLQSCETAAALVPLGLIAAFDIARKSGRGSQARISAKFAKALREASHRVWIGGVPWTIVDGEFRHIAYDAGARGQLLEAGTSRDERKGAELEGYQERLGQFFVFMIKGVLVELAWGAAMLTWAASQEDAIFLMNYFLVGFLVWGSWKIGKEFLFSSGFQRLEGAMVLDPSPYRPGLAEVEQQKAHGDARLATEIEAQTAALAGSGRRSLVHDQRF